jgi:hypothetical protein
MAADRNDASLAPAESDVEVDVDDEDVRRSSMLRPEKRRPVSDNSLPCNTLKKVRTLLTCFGDGYS